MPLSERSGFLDGWRPPPAIGLTAAFHLGGLATLAVAPELWPHVGATLIANHAALGVGVMLPRSSLLGPNLRRLPEAAVRRREVALTFDDGPDPTVTPRILDLLDRHDARATFFCVGLKALAQPDIVREIVRRGHGVENHSNRHANGFAVYGPRRLHRDIAAAQETLAAIAGQAPAYFRAPMGLRSPFLDLVLGRVGLKYVSWTRRGFDTVDDNPAKVLSRLTRGLGPGDILMLHDTRGLRRRNAIPTALAVLPELLGRVAAGGLKPVSLRSACHA